MATFETISSISHCKQLFVSQHLNPNIQNWPAETAVINLNMIIKNFHVIYHTILVEKKVCDSPNNILQAVSLMRNKIGSFVKRVLNCL